MAKSFQSGMIYSLAVWILMPLPLSQAAAVPPQVQLGAGIVVDNSGLVIFTDTGQGVWSLDSRNSLRALDRSPYAWMAIDSEGLSATALPSTMLRIPLSGSKSALILSSDRPVAVGKDGSLYYAPDAGNAPFQIVRRSPDGNTSVFATIYSDWDGKPLKSINGIAAGGDGQVYFTENNAVRKVDSESVVTNLARDIQLPNCSPLPGNEFPIRPYMRGLTLDTEGNVYAAATGCRSILRIGTNGAISVPFLTESPWSPTGVAISGGDIYILEYNHSPGSNAQRIPRISKLAADGKVTVLTTVRRTSP